MNLSHVSPFHSRFVPTFITSRGKKSENRLQPHVIIILYTCSYAMHIMTWKRGYITYNWSVYLNRNKMPKLKSNMTLFNINSVMTIFKNHLKYCTNSIRISYYDNHKYICVPTTLHTIEWKTTTKNKVYGDFAHYMEHTQMITLKNYVRCPKYFRMSTFPILHDYCFRSC